MKKHVIKKMRYIVLTVFVLLLSVTLENVVLHAQNEMNNEIDKYVAIDENGKVTYLPLEKEVRKAYIEPKSYEIVDIDKNMILASFDTYQEANAALQKKQNRKIESDDENLAICGNEEVRTIDYGVVRFTAGVNTLYKNVETGRNDGYTNGSYAPDAAYLGTSADGTKIRFKQANVIGEVNASEVRIIPYTSSLVISKYITSNGKLYHTLTTNMNTYQSTVQVGYMPSYMNNNATYYSYDGHYFYHDFKSMIDDYRSGTYTKAINSSNPYYNYFQYLSHRSKTNFTAEQLDAFVAYQTAGNTSSKMYQQGKNFLSTQNRWGVNALLMYGVAANESAWGTSQIAKDKNNLFGHGAVDDNPYWGANGYESPAKSIEYHGEYFVSKGYLNIADWRYYGANTGDKQSGLNVKYASDPYWGEKAAAQGYYLENYYGNKNIDYGKKTIGIVNGTINIRKEASTSSPALYNTGQGTSGDLLDYPIIILETVTGSNVNGNNQWYKIQTDIPLVSDRSVVSSKSEYSFTRDYAYIHSSNVKIVHEGNENENHPNQLPTIQKINQSLGLTITENYATGFKVGESISDFISRVKKVNDECFVSVKNKTGVLVSSGKVSTGYTYTIKGSDGIQTFTIVIKGDVNGDGQIYATDYVFVKNHIMGKTKLNGAFLKAADIDKNGKIYATDYVFIKNYIMGKGLINQ